MRWTVLYESDVGPSPEATLPEAFFRGCAGRLYLGMLSAPEDDDPVSLLVPEGRIDGWFDGTSPVVLYPPGGLFGALLNRREAVGSSVLILSNGRYLKQYHNADLLERAARFEWDVLSVRIAPALASGREGVRLASDRRIVGFRRLYVPGLEPDVPSGQWPALLLLNAAAKERLKTALPIRTYPEFLEALSRCQLRVRHIRFGGQVWDLCEEDGWFAFLEQSGGWRSSPASASEFERRQVRIVGNVHIGRGVRIGRCSILVGPAILSDGAEVGEDSLLHNVWIGEGVRLADGSRLQNRVLLGNSQESSDAGRTAFRRAPGRKKRGAGRSPFRTWPFISYPILGKRLFDLFVSCIVLILFLPFLLLIALAVRLTSRGPVFYGARRQGLHSREFNCLKFRTMMVQAEAIQDRLRIANQVDGPQFKIEDDPRITRIGKFLRDTSIDEIPQFFNVLIGQMSVVGPRPSPESENETCPYWRDARLSVRPGITGLWQVMRTRQVSMDFQEWIYYDTRYVRRVSFGLDLWICLKTAQKLINSFLDQFG